jgi:hypothetical protein
MIQFERYTNQSIIRQKIEVNISTSIMGELRLKIEARTRYHFGQLN